MTLRFFLLLLVLAPASPAWSGSGGQPSHDEPPGLVASPGSDLWREVRRRPAELRVLQEAGTRGDVRTQVQGVETTVLIHARGEQWRKYRREWLIPYGGWLLGGAALLVVLLYLLVGRKSRAPAESGRRLLRFDGYERTLHWFMAALFLFLGLTGLLLLYGRPLLIPLLGREVFSAIASASKEGHNLFGPLFLVSLLLFARAFWRRNLYERGDLAWLFSGGRRGHAGFFNFGEKILFWMVVLVGLAISGTGLVLLFPNFQQGRLVMEGAHLIHTLGAVFLIALIFGHVYMAQAVRGTIDGMNTGYVEYEWARRHHERWAREEETTGRVVPLEVVEQALGRKGYREEAGS